MTAEEYNTYLGSADWKLIAEKRKEIDGHRCVMCRSIGTMNNPLECHHITYRNIGNEDVYKDVMTLCRNCHKSIHRAMNRVTDESGRKGWKDSLPMSNHVLNNK